MKRFLSAVAFCVVLLVVVSLSFLPSTEAQNNILQNLLDLPAPPPPNPLFYVREANRAGNFYDKKTPLPADDAPLEDLIDYWRTQSQNYRDLGYNIKPSSKTLERILDDVKENPETLTNYINSLPRNSDTVEFVKKIYDEEIADDKFGEEWQSSVRNWLKMNSNYFSDELVEAANEITDTEEYISSQDELLALARVDWDKARPIVERLYNDKSKPVSGVLARWAFYTHALETGSIDVSRYRDELKAIVEDKTASNGMRDLAMDALTKEKEWDGRDDWYLSLLGDETLAELEIDGRTFTGLTTIIYQSPPDRFVEKMLELLKSDNPVIRTAVIKNLSLLLSSGNEEVIRALLPWLSDAKWAKESGGERRALLEALQSITMPESVPGLITILNEKSTVTISANTYSNSNVMMSNRMSNISTMPTANTISNKANVTLDKNDITREVYQYRIEAVQALAKQRDARAVPALRGILPQIDVWERGNVIRAIFFSNGFSVAEQIDALESVIKERVSNMNANTMKPVGNYSPNMMVINGNYSMDRPFNPSEIKPILGTLLINNPGPDRELANNPEPDRELVRALVARIAELDKKDVPLASGLRQVIKNWNGAAVNALLLNDLKNGKADLDSIVKLLSLRKELREKQSGEVFAVRGGNPIANGIAACILESESDYEGILAGENVDAKIALLGCARLTRARLPIEKVAELIKSPNKMLATAAENWLESEDSSQARQIVLANHPNEAKILGARMTFMSKDAPSNRSEFLTQLFYSVNNSIYIPYYSEYAAEILKATEVKLQKEITETNELLGIYTYDRNFLRLYKDKVVFSWEEDEARYRERTLSGNEFNEFRDFLVAQNVDALKPFISNCYDCADKELLMLGKQGGRRVYVRTERPPPFFAKLDKFFEEMRKPSAKLRYYLEKDITGLEILFADKNFQALAVWKTGDDFRVLIDDTKRRKQIDKELELQYETEANREDVDYEKLEEDSRKRIQQREFEHLSWQKFADGNLAGFANQPAQIDFIPVRDSFSARATGEQWKARTATVEVRDGDEELIKIVGGKASKIANGYYTSPVVTENGRWAIVTKYDRESEEISLVRINLATNKEFKVAVKEVLFLQAVVFIPSLNKVLIAQGSYYERSVNSDGAFLLLDAETGAMQPAKGDFRPLVQQTFRPLQPTGIADEFWAAIPNAEQSETQIGTYNSKTFTFKPLMKVPRIRFDSMQMWIDAGKIYFVYEGHLLALPLPK